MKERLLSAHIDATTKKVVAITDNACYIYKKELNEMQTKQLMKKLESAQEIEIDHWDIEFKFKNGA